MRIVKHRKKDFTIIEKWPWFWFVPHGFIQIDGEKGFIFLGYRIYTGRNIFRRGR